MLSIRFLHRTEMFANLIKRYGTCRSSTRYLQRLSGKLRVFVYTVHGVIDEYHASNNKKCNAFGFWVHNFAFQEEYPGEFDKTVDCKLKSANRFRLCLMPAQQKEDSYFDHGVWTFLKNAWRTEQKFARKFATNFRDERIFAEFTPRYFEHNKISFESSRGLGQ